MVGTLYVVTTPLGNLQDLTPRAAQTFAEVDFIAAEDTRVTLRLLNHLGLKKPMISYYEHNANLRGEGILNRIEAGESCALCSDAGVPAISDPGEALVMEAHQRGIRVVPIPAASAAVTALCVSGQNTSRFVFEGFLPQNRGQRNTHLDALKNETRTMLLYEAPHKLKNTLRDLCGVFGEEHSVTLCRELTKLHEEITKTTLRALRERFETENPRGEIVLVLAGAEPANLAEDTPSLESAAEMAAELSVTQNIKKGEAARQIAAQTGHPKSAIYRMMQDQADTF
ncbi:MAG: 16S rRNA (cytidine(1402)-2'-O)-methyltransferase [Oscillospiraceae bacterium]